MAINQIHVASVYQGLAHKKLTFSGGELQSQGPAENWAIDSLASYSPGAITSLTGHEGYGSAPSFAVGSATIGTYACPRTGVTLNYMDLNPAGTELILPFKSGWVPWADVNTCLLLSLPDTGGTINVECFSGWCQAASGGYSNPSTQIIFTTKWYNGSGFGFGGYTEPLTRVVDPADGHVYYTCTPLARRRANGTADTTGLQNGTLYISAHGGASPTLKRSFMSWHSLRNPVWWYAYMNTPYNTTAPGTVPRIADANFNHAMRQCRAPNRTSGPTWIQGLHCNAGNQNFQVLPYYTNGEMDSFFLYYRESTATYPLRIYFIGSDLINLYPGQ